MVENRQVAIVGGGPAGLAAAIEAAHAGAKVLLIDENARPGGQLFKQIHKFFGSKAHNAGIRGVDIGQKLLQQTAEAGVEVWLSSTVIGLHEGNNLAVVRTIGEEKKICTVHAERILICTGGQENAINFEGWTLPGVMGAGCAQTMINNACTMQSYIDDKTEGEKLYVQCYDTVSDHIYTVSTKWNATNEKGKAFFGDVKNMCRKLSKRGLHAADLVIGSDVADAILGLEDVKTLLDRNSGIIIGTIDQQLSAYDGVVYMGTLNFGGFRLNVICVDETYVDDSGAEQRYFPATSAMVTAPGCGHMMYGQITQIDYGSTDFATYAAKRVPKFVLDQPGDKRKLRLAARPLAAPKDDCPYIYAADVVS